MVCLLVSFGGGVLAGIVVERGKECSKVGLAGDGLAGVVEEHRRFWGMGVGFLREWGLRLGESFVVRGYGIVESVRLG
jgi:hypothetical protein